MKHVKEESKSVEEKQTKQMQAVSQQVREPKQAAKVREGAA